MAQMRMSEAPQRPLQTVYIDHVRVDALAVDPTNGETGQPWLTLAFDEATRMVTGVHVSLAPPSRVSAGLCLLHSVCDKTGWMDERGLKGEWPASGLPETIVADAQSFFGVRGFLRACRDQGVTTRSRTPQSRAYGVFAAQMLAPRLGAISISQDAADGFFEDAPCSGPARRDAPQSLRDLERRIGDAIVNGYHRKRHHDLRAAPLDAWRESREPARFRAPEDCLRFRLSFFPEELLPIGEDGVELMGEKFWSPTLAQFRADGQHDVPVRFDPRDLTRIFVRNAGGRFVRVKNVNARSGDVTVCSGDGSLASRAPAPSNASVSCGRKCRTSCPFTPIG